jgi:hypothetical protein
MTVTTRVQRRELLINSSLLAGGAAIWTMLPCRASSGAGTNLTELGAAAAVEAMRNGDIKAEDYART